MWPRREGQKLPAMEVQTIAANDESTCPICQEDIGSPTPEGVSEGWSILPCGHGFGALCIKRWLGMVCRPVCPICRTPAHHACGHPVVPTLTGDQHCLGSTVSVDSSADTAATDDGTGLIPDGSLSGASIATQQRSDPRQQLCPFCAGRRRLYRSSTSKRILVSALRVLKLLCRSNPRRYYQQRIARMEMELNASYAKWWAQQEPSSNDNAPPFFALNRPIRNGGIYW